MFRWGALQVIIFDRFLPVSGCIFVAFARLANFGLHVLLFLSFLANFVLHFLALFGQVRADFFFGAFCPLSGVHFYFFVWSISGFTFLILALFFWQISCCILFSPFWPMLSTKGGLLSVLSFQGILGGGILSDGGGGGGYLKWGRGLPMYMAKGVWHWHSNIVSNDQTRWTVQMCTRSAIMCQSCVCSVPKHVCVALRASYTSVSLVLFHAPSTAQCGKGLWSGTSHRLLIDSTSSRLPGARRCLPRRVWLTAQAMTDGHH